MGVLFGVIGGDVVVKVEVKFVIVLEFVVFKIVLEVGNVVIFVLFV